MNAKLIERELIEEFGADFQPIITSIVERLEKKFFVKRLRLHKKTEGDTFWINGLKYVTEKTNESDNNCKACVARFNDQLCTALPNCPWGYFFKEIEE